MNSFKSTIEFQQNTMGLPITWTLANYSGAWRIGNFDKLFLKGVTANSPQVISMLKNQ